MEVEARHLEQDEAIVAELVETVELQAHKLESLGEEVDRLRTERSQLSGELHMARAWIRELAAELQHGGAPTAPEAGSLRGRIQGEPA